MKLLALDAPHEITQHGSIGAMVGGVANVGGWARVAVIQLEPGGVLGMHPAAVPQLLLVADGRASVRSGDNPPLEIAQGQGVYWEAGEPHETTSGETGLTAIVIEAETLDLL
jgi:quercetin dioxygenase-like cupin family protein